MATASNQKQNDSFYALLKEIVETQSDILKRIDAMTAKLGGTPAKTHTDLWRSL